MQARIAGQLSAFMGRGYDPVQGFGRAPLSPSKCPRSFRITPGCVMRCGFPWRGRSKPQHLRQSVRVKWAYRSSPGGVGVLVLKGSMGKLVHVQERKYEVDVSAVSASLDGDPLFSRGPARALNRAAAGIFAGSTWHAYRVHHRCRSMGSAEACCERVGSHMRKAWFSARHPTAARLMDSVALDTMHVTCCGNPRDERIAQEVTEILLQAGKKPLLRGQRHMKQREEEGIHISRFVTSLRQEERAWMEASGRAVQESEASESEMSQILDGFGVGDVTNANLRALRSGARRPPRLESSAVVDALAGVVVDGEVRGLPLFKERTKTAKKHRADSVLREGANTWLSSPEGQLWLNSRKVLDEPRSRLNDL